MALDEDFELANAFYRDNLRVKMEAIVNKINADAKCHGEMYAVGSFINDVRNIPHELSLLTFTVKQINGRFKFLDVVKTVQGMVSKQRRGVVEYLVEEWRFLPQQVAVHSDGDGAGVMCIGGGSCSDSESLMDWE
ncbi:uncharacterized protein LOC125218047 [Salvia hispanica]|uniref:uncharacterized protein LOC125218047 n=1 Tax=Salvia hispanica TaxID=49212 RepID=UPI0020096F7C|nr:uncharacterized protein LOC125218047 [Salvia hispanica]XP_047975600.1 uncharacterized protein LOC125218047 [Salvia hispanica]